MRPPKPSKVKQKSKATDEGGRGEYKKYTSADMVHAVSVVVNGTHSFRAAVQCFRFREGGYPNGDTRQWDINLEAVRNKVYETIKEQKEGGAITAVNTIAQPEGAVERETVTESILDNVIGMPSDPLQLLAHAVCVSALPDVKSAAVECTYQQIKQEPIVQNSPEHPLICEVLALTPDQDKCSKRYKMPWRRRIMGEDVQMLCGEGTP
eukprot:jgi/Tetstr1/442680/TSEL_030772.t1